MSRVADWIFTAVFFGLIVAAFLYGRHTAFDEAHMEQLTQRLQQAETTEQQLQTALQKQAELEEALTQAQVKTRVIREQVKVYVEPDKDEYCGPSVGVISVLNAARANLPDYSPATVEEGRAASGYSASDFNDQYLDVIERYNALALRYNTLVELLSHEPN